MTADSQRRWEDHTSKHKRAVENWQQGEALSSQLLPHDTLLQQGSPPKGSTAQTVHHHLENQCSHTSAGGGHFSNSHRVFKVRAPRHFLRSPSGDWLRQVINHQNSENLEILYSRSPQSMVLGQGLQHPHGTLQNFVIQVLPGTLQVLPN